MTIPYMDTTSVSSVSSDVVPKFKTSNSLSLNPDGTSWFMSGIILANIVLGLGLLNMPEAFRNAGGIINAILTQMVCLVFLVSGYMMISYCSEMYNNTSYQSMVRSHCGPRALFICSIVIFAHNFGTCITFLVLLSDQLDEIMAYVFGSDFCDFWYLRRTVTMPSCGLLFILPFCFVDRIDGIKLKIISVIGVVSTAYVIFLVIYKYYSVTELPQVEWRTSRWSDTLSAVPVICFSFEAHVEAVPVYSSLRRQNMGEFLKTVTLAMSVSLFVYTSVGIYGYLYAGVEVTSDILLSYYPADIVVIIGTAIIALKSITTYPGVFFCARIVTDDISIHCCHKIGLSAKRRKNLEATCFFLVSVSIALLIPTIGSVIKLLGGTAALFIMVFPGVCFMKANLHDSGHYWAIKVTAGAIMVIVGVFLASSSTIYSVQNYINQQAQMEGKVCGLL